MRKNETWKAVLLGFLLAVLAAGLWMRSRQGPVETIDPELHKAWFEVARRPALDVSFEVRAWKAVEFGKRGVGAPNMRTEVKGEFASDSPASMALMDAENFNRLRSGYPPLGVRAFRPGAVDVTNPGEPCWFVFFQEKPKQAAAPFPTTGLQLGLLILRSLAEAAQPPAHISAKFDEIVSVFTDPATAAKLRAEFRKPQSSAPAPKKPRPMFDPIGPPVTMPIITFRPSPSN